MPATIAAKVRRSILAFQPPRGSKGFCFRSVVGVVTEAFLIENGKIRRVEMVGPSVLYHLNSPWGGLSGN